MHKSHTCNLIHCVWWNVCFTTEKSVVFFKLLFEGVRSLQVSPVERVILLPGPRPHRGDAHREGSCAVPVTMQQVKPSPTASQSSPPLLLLKLSSAWDQPMGALVFPVKDLLPQPQLVLDQWFHLDGALPESEILLRAELKVKPVHTVEDQWLRRSRMAS